MNKNIYAVALVFCVNLSMSSYSVAQASPIVDPHKDVTKDATDAKEPSKKKWDVNNPPGEKATVNLDTKTGTWMTVDVSPDGKQIVFDLLGDLYLLPIAGGEAKPLTSSIA